jgi:hypothetical protein
MPLESVCFLQSVKLSFMSLLVHVTSRSCHLLLQKLMYDPFMRRFDKCKLLLVLCLVTNPSVSFGFFSAVREMDKTY